MGQPHGVGIVGLGTISQAYLQTLVGHPGVRIAAVADLDLDRARSAAETIPDAIATDVDGLLADPAVQTVLNLTIPAAHADIAIRAMRAGKDVYGEKPLAADLEQGRDVLRVAGQTGRRVGCAPDTVLGTGLQTARAAVDAGAIGRPASATWVSPGHESWHPDPGFYYLDGGGPLLDMGPYYVTALVQLLGPVTRVSGAASRLRDERVVASGPKTGHRIPVQVDTHVAGILEHIDGAISTVVMSFEAVSGVAEPIEVHGQEASLIVPDPNGFDGDVRLRRRGEDRPRIIPVSAGYEAAARGVGLLDFIAAAPERGRANGELALHVLEIMTAVLQASRVGRVELTTTARRPAAVPLIPRQRWRQGSEA